MIMKICTNRHPNIVQVLQHDWFVSHSTCFIDMDLCDLTLHDYIKNRAAFVAESPELFDNLAFVEENCSPQLKLRNIWMITLHIANALNFIHKMGYVHRDLKPLNSNTITKSVLTLVLYSRQMKSWKVADFGLTTEGASKLAITTRNGRGTGGYRAPELLSEFSKFTKKVDIWALGCILYELAMGEKAFNDDYSVLSFLDSRSTLPSLNPIIPNGLMTHLSECVYEMLKRNPQQRPSISILLPLIEFYCLLLDSVALDEIKSIPGYSHFKKLEEENLEESWEILSFLADWYQTGQSESKNYLLKIFPDLPRQLVEYYVGINNWDAAVKMWKYIVDKDLCRESSHERLASAYQAKGSIEDWLKIMEEASPLSCWWTGGYPFDFIRSKFGARCVSSRDGITRK